MSRATDMGVTETTSALERLEAWLERENFAGWDPHDALNSPLLTRVTRNNRLLGILVLQAMRRSPLNVRPLLRVAKGHNPKAMGLFLTSYLCRPASSGSARVHPRALFFAEWLQHHALTGYAGACWGYNFAWPNRGFRTEQGAPTIVATSFIALSLLDAADAGVPGCATMARSACEFIRQDLPRDSDASDECCFSYVPHSRRFIHNANVLAGALLAEVAARTDDAPLGELALHAARYTVRRQRPDGSWWYGVGRLDRWIDNFHTGYVLVGLRRISRALDVTEFDDAIDGGYRFWKERMFTADERPKYYLERAYPIDIHAVAQAILTFLAFRDRDPGAATRAWRLADWATEHMQDRDGYFHYQLQRLYRNRIPYMRWSQAWMHRALTELLFSAPPVATPARTALAAAGR